jgi:hypothetical protein
MNAALRKPTLLVVQLVAVTAAFTHLPANVYAAPNEGASNTTLADARLDAARSSYKETMQLYKEGRTRDVDRIYLWSQRWLDAQRALSNKKTDQQSAFDGHWKRMRQLEELVNSRFKAGVAAQVELPAVRFYRIEAEIWLSQAAK